MSEKILGWFCGTVIIWTIVFAVGGYAFIRPWYAKQHGKAELARAEQSRQITIVEAEAKKESAKRLAEAEVFRAEGVAKANHIIAGSLKDNEAYLRYLWIIEGLSKCEDKVVIYVPTEANLPLFSEAGRPVK